VGQCGDLIKVGVADFARRVVIKLAHGLAVLDDPARGNAVRIGERGHGLFHDLKATHDRLFG
jgi:hypothetical protein